jgi:hypothetical protein
VQARRDNAGAKTDMRFGHAFAQSAIHHSAFGIAATPPHSGHRAGVARRSYPHVRQRPSFRRFDCRRRGPEAWGGGEVWSWGGDVRGVCIFTCSPPHLLTSSSAPARRRSRTVGGGGIAHSHCNALCSDGLPAPEQAVVLGVVTDPEPDAIVAGLDGERAIVEASAHDQNRPAFFRRKPGWEGLALSSW